jgi:hypothetical protein
MSRQTETAGLVARLSRGLLCTGIMREGEQLTLTTGSKLYGNSYALWVGTPETPHGFRPFGTLHLGFTYAECERSLLAAACALEAAMDAEVTR